LAETKTRFSRLVGQTKWSKSKAKTEHRNNGATTWAVTIDPIIMRTVNKIGVRIIFMNFRFAEALLRLGSS